MRQRDLHGGLVEGLLVELDAGTNLREVALRGPPRVRTQLLLHVEYLRNGSTVLLVVARGTLIEFLPRTLDDALFAFPHAHTDKEVDAIDLRHQVGILEALLEWTPLIERDERLRKDALHVGGI